ncbi:MAG: substrate-binding domain-containing protein [Clostridia bacterium]|nr:substrate-binding domain-containing protein [Clostridia bacterium]
MGKKIIIVAVSIMWLFLIGCNQKKDDGVVKIGYSADTLVIERWQRDKAYFLEKANEEGIEVIAYNANESNATQVKQIRELLDANVDVLVIIPYDKDGLKEVVQEAIDKGIKIISYDRLISDVNIDAYVSFDNIKVGSLMAEALVAKQPTGNYVLINGSPEDNNSAMFHEGYMSVLKPYIDSEQITIVNEVWANDWREEPAYNAVIDAIHDGYEINAIIGANDHLADAAISALSINGQAGNVLVAGHDADVSACQRIVEGTQYVTIYKPIKKLAETAFELAVQLAEGKSVESELTINNGYDIPYIKLDVIAVTKENMDETVILDKFHKREDIYRD